MRGEFLLFEDGTLEYELDFQVGDEEIRVEVHS